MAVPSATGDAATPVVTIAAIGAQGDGIAEHDGRTLYVPFTLPGDRVRVGLGATRGEGIAAAVLERLAEGPGHAEPPCRHFGVCGGCQLQHLETEPYRAWKSALLGTALAHRGLDPAAVRPMIAIPPGSRRRARFAALRQAAAVRLGFRERASKRIVDLAHCPILTEPLQRLLPALRRMAAALLADRGEAELEVTASATGIDLLIVQSGRPPVAAARGALATIAAEAGILRVSWMQPKAEPEPIALLGAPQMRFGGVAVDLPPGGFLQPSAAGEAALLAEIEHATAGATRIADLFSGCGSFSLPLSARAKVHAVEGDKPAATALEAAAKRAGLGHRLTVERRDLERAPLQTEELARFDAVIFDPPRAGAAAQSRALAASKVARVVGVSCNPASFARDARVLADAGYRLDWAVPVDQFPWSPHLELVACFSR
jgi:23S rRNA (uracil1939-C5)-methyltransferase